MDNNTDNTKMTTKEAIVYESLKLFSTNGYDAVSTRMIAKGVNLSDAVIYKHFKNKREILDTIVTICKEKYRAKTAAIAPDSMDWKMVEQICMDIFKFQVTDEWMVLFRKLLTVEQYKNPEMGKIFREIWIDAPLEKLSSMFSVLIEQGYVKKVNPKVLATDIYAPFFMYRSAEMADEEILKILQEHVTNFRYNAIADESYLIMDEKYRRK